MQPEWGKQSSTVSFADVLVFKKHAMIASPENYLGRLFILQYLLKLYYIIFSLTFMKHDEKIWEDTHVILILFALKVHCIMFI